ncbi:YwdI family protein [Kurthia senegalensis]|uniref:YwdI family protein n=1 Tax=Kurthia senegalensis TaxID=1033740 RepID=UPI00028967BA|nr:YwdI family protein [Kurthia senegalensis]
MISYDDVIQQIQKQALRAKEASNDSQKREQLAAIQALCEVALMGETIETAPSYVSQNAPMQTMVNQPIIQQATPVFESKKMVEADANGDSLFDF